LPDRVLNQVTTVVPLGNDAVRGAGMIERDRLPCPFRRAHAAPDVIKHVSVPVLSDPYSDEKIADAIAADKNADYTILSVSEHSPHRFMSFREA
jgi:hypothetical protein